MFDYLLFKLDIPDYPEFKKPFEIYSLRRYSSQAAIYANLVCK